MLSSGHEVTVAPISSGHLHKTGPINTPSWMGDELMRPPCFSEELIVMVGAIVNCIWLLEEES